MADPKSPKASSVEELDVFKFFKVFLVIDSTWWQKAIPCMFPVLHRVANVTMVTNKSRPPVARHREIFVFIVFFRPVSLTD